MYSLPNCRVHELRGEEHFFSLDITLSNQLMCALASLSRTNSVLDDVFCQYLSYMKTSSTKYRLFSNFVVNCFENDNTKQRIASEAKDNLEAIIDIDNDICVLSNLSNRFSVKAYYSALVHSQLFEVPLQRKSHHLYTLNEYSKLSKRTSSFISFHDEGQLLTRLI